MQALIDNYSLRRKEMHVRVQRLSSLRGFAKRWLKKRVEPAGGLYRPQVKEQQKPSWFHRRSAPPVVYFFPDDDTREWHLDGD